MKRIVALFPELLGVGGVQEAGRLTALALGEIARRHGWLTDLLSLNDSPGPQTLHAGSEQIRFRGFGRGKMRFAFAAARAARRDARIVLAAHPNLAVPATWMRLVSPRLGIIVMSHGVEVWQRLPASKRRALQRANLVLAPSRYTATQLAQMQSLPPDKIRRLAWPLDPSFLRMADTPGPLPLPKAFPQGRVILTVGRWAASERYKGVDGMIVAVAQLRPVIPDLHLLAVGDGDDLPRLRKLAADRGVADRVRFLDGLSREEIAACYAHAELFALPSTGEGFGLVFLEAMAFGKPIVAANFGGATDLVENEINGLLVPPGNGGELSRALRRLLRDDRLRSELGRRGAEIVRRKYQFEAFQASLEQVLEECGLERLAT